LLICAQSAVDDNATAMFLDGEIKNFGLIGNKEPEIVRTAPEQAVKWGRLLAKFRRFNGIGLNSDVKSDP
jgi:hypothetical protein